MSQRPPVAMTRMKSRINPRILLLGFDMCCLLRIFDELIAFLMASWAERINVSKRSPTLGRLLEVEDFKISAVELVGPFPLEKYGLPASIA